jgi:hypothetical protein
MGDGGWSEEKRRYAVKSKGKLSNNSCLVVFFPEVLTGWAILLKLTLINQ